jgi:molybdopterin-containing oxidoreductase family iron-sulfur binding subunit
MTRRNAYPTVETPAEARGEAKPIWRSLEERTLPTEERARRADTEAEGTGFLSADRLTIGRRGFLAASTVTAAAGLLEGCVRRPEEHILPYTDMPEHVVPGVALHFATVTERLGDSMGLLVTSHEGRPTKVEGNPRHPSTANGAADVWSQASLMDLYDPDRSTTPMSGGEAKSWEEVAEALASRVASHDRDGGQGLHVVTPPLPSPSFFRIKKRFLERFPQARFHTWASVSDTNLREGTRIAFGRPLNQHTDFRGARVILSIDSDFLMTEPNALTNTWRFAGGRQMQRPEEDMNRLYVVEPGHSVTGSNADHRLRLPSSQMGRYLKALARELLGRGEIELDPAVAGALGSSSTDGIPAQWIAEVAVELAANKGRAAIVAGLRQPPAVHALVHALNRALNNEGRTVVFTRVADDMARPPSPPPAAGEVPVAPESDAMGDYVASLAELAEGLSGARTVLLLGINPVYDAPADLGFGEALGGVDFSVHLGTHLDETAAATSWHVPMAHFLETWGDLRSRDGTYSVQQPLIAPLYGGKSVIEMLAIALGDEDTRGYSQVRETVREEVVQGPAFAQTWRALLHAGVLEGSTTRPEAGAELQHAEIAAALSAYEDAAMPTSDALEIAFVPCGKMLDGRHANNMWLQELPDNMSKLVWDNAALVSPATAEQLGLSDRDVVRITAEGATVEAAIQTLPGVADNTIVAPLGWGRTAAGRYGNGQGFDFGPLRTTSAFWHRGGARVEATGDQWFLVRTQEHGTMQGRPIAIDATVDEYRDNPEFTQFRAVEMDIPPLWDQVDYDGKYKWGMSIDLTACTGCNACVIACQAENNIPAVGKGMVARGREMYWIRMDRYFVGEDVNDPQVAFQPVACQQCEEAPCENVCPVNATAHSPEGLNDMAYNRCIGTRYCANNCPYKVRRFNYLNYHEYLEEPGFDRGLDPESWIPETRRMAYNPNVTVRMRGVMEKCTYCVQRLEEAKIQARRDDRPMAEGSLQTACQQGCPAKAIFFGCLNGYPYVVRKGSQLVGMNAQEIAQRFGLRDVRIEKERVVEEGRGPVENVESIVDDDAFQNGEIRYTVYSSTRLPELQSRDRHYKLLVEIGTHPRTTFLGRIRNPNSEMA